MQRRDFCKLLAIAAASKALPSAGRTAQESQPGLPSGFNQYTQDYAQFCAQPPEKRVFYKVSDGKIIEERLEEVAWQPPAWNYNPVAQSVAGGLWDDVPLRSPIPDLANVESIRISAIDCVYIVEFLQLFARMTEHAQNLPV